MIKGRGCRVLLALLISSSLIMATTAAGAETPAGQVVRLEGDALVTRAGAGTTVPLEPEEPVYLGDRIQTLEDSRIELRFEDETVVLLGASSTLRISEFVLSAAGERDSALLDLVSGIFRAIVTRVLPNAAFEVRTKQVVAAVRGTDWMAEVGDDTVSVVVLEGAVAVRRADEEVVLRNGDGVDVRPGEPLQTKRWGRGRIEGFRERMFRPINARGRDSDPAQPRAMKSAPLQAHVSSARGNLY